MTPHRMSRGSESHKNEVFQMKQYNKPQAKKVDFSRVMMNNR
ncbi:hypothetical protein [Streptomyces sp. NPDC091259]